MNQRAKVLHYRRKLFQNSLLVFLVNIWNKLNLAIRWAESHLLFQEKLLELIRPTRNNTYPIHDPLRTKLLNRLRVGFSYLWEHKFRHNFADTLNPLWACALEPECIECSLLRCDNYITI